MSVDVSANISFEQEVEQVVAETKKYRLHRLHDASYGSMIPVENLLGGKFDEYTALYIEMPYPVSKKGLHLQPAGTYLRAFCKGSWDKISDKYKEILAYVDKHGLSLYGFAYEKGINELVIDTLDDYITQIEIPVTTEYRGFCQVCYFCCFIAHGHYLPGYNCFWAVASINLIRFNWLTSLAPGS